jgi:hypothetical protein
MVIFETCYNRFSAYEQNTRAPYFTDNLFTGFSASNPEFDCVGPGQRRFKPGAG